MAGPSDDFRADPHPPADKRRSMSSTTIPTQPITTSFTDGPREQLPVPAVTTTTALVLPPAPKSSWKLKAGETLSDAVFWGGGFLVVTAHSATAAALGAATALVAFGATAAINTLQRKQAARTPGVDVVAALEGPEHLAALRAEAESLSDKQLKSLRKGLERYTRKENNGQEFRFTRKTYVREPGEPAAWRPDELMLAPDDVLTTLITNGQVCAGQIIRIAPTEKAVLPPTHATTIRSVAQLRSFLRLSVGL